MGFPTILPTKVVSAHRNVLQADAPHKLWLFQPWLRLELYQKIRAVFYQVLLKLLLDPDFLSFWGQGIQNLLSLSHKLKAVQQFCFSIYEFFYCPVKAG